MNNQQKIDALVILLSVGKQGNLVFNCASNHNNVKNLTDKKQ